MDKAMVLKKHSGINSKRHLSAHFFCFLRKISWPFCGTFIKIALRFWRLAGAAALCEKHTDKAERKQ